LTPIIVETTDQNLNANMWDDGEAWNFVFNLKNITPAIPKKGDVFRFRISGTPDKTLEKLNLSIEAHTEDWSSYQWLGGSESIRVIGTFEHTFEIEIGEDPNPGNIIGLDLSNNVLVPPNVKRFDTVATIKDFKIRFVGIVPL